LIAKLPVMSETIEDPNGNIISAQPVTSNFFQTLNQCQPAQP